MVRCQALTKSGQPCKNEALPGSDYCRVHQPAPKEEPVIIRVGEKTVRLRYHGQGRYFVADLLFTPEDPVKEVPERLAEFLLDTEPEVFELEER